MTWWVVVDDRKKWGVRNIPIFYGTLYELLKSIVENIILT